MEKLGKTEFIHYRAKGPEGLLPKGGVTVCYHPHNDMDKAAVSVAICSLRDNFSRKRGRNISHGRSEDTGLFIHGRMTREELMAFAEQTAQEAWSKVHHRRLSKEPLNIVHAPRSKKRISN